MSPIAETILAVPLVVVPVRVMGIVLVLKSITPIITMLVLIAFVRSAGVTSHIGALHIEKPSIRRYGRQICCHHGSRHRRAPANENQPATLRLGR